MKIILGWGLPPRCLTAVTVRGSHGPPLGIIEDKSPGAIVPYTAGFYFFIRTRQLDSAIELRGIHINWSGQEDKGRFGI